MLERASSLLRLRAVAASPVQAIEGPPDAVIHRIHDRYLVEVVEALGLCPFARRSRELGRVHRPLFRLHRGVASAETAARALADVARAHADAEIVLLTFVDPQSIVPRGSFRTPTEFDAFVADVRHAFSLLDAPRFYMVGFHPESGSLAPDRPLTKDTLVPLIRRSPDPVVQCVSAEVLERVRVQAQEAAHRRLLESVADEDPLLRALVERSVQPDSELSADIARHNFDAVGSGPGLAELVRRLEDIRRDRDRSYAPFLRDADPMIAPGS